MKCQYRVSPEAPVCGVPKQAHVTGSHVFVPNKSTKPAKYQLRVFGGRSQPAVLQGSLEDVRMLYRMLEGEYPTRATFGIYYRDKEVKMDTQPQETSHEPASHPPASGVPKSTESDG